MSTTFKSNMTMEEFEIWRNKHGTTSKAGD